MQMLKSLITLSLAFGILIVPAQATDDLYSTLPGRIEHIYLAPGEYVGRDTPIMELVCMKMRKTICAHQHGYIQNIFVQMGQVVENHVLLANISQIPPRIPEVPMDLPILVE
jgi:biotin carboxyl carrier protein